MKTTIVYGRTWSLLAGIIGLVWLSLRHFVRVKTFLPLKFTFS